jgi:hypothetical protein
MRTAVLCFVVTLLATGCSRESGGGAAAGTPRFDIAPRDVVATSTTLETGWAVNPTQQIAVLHVQLSDSKAAEFREFTKRHVNQRVEFLAAGKSVCQPRISREVTSGTIEMPFGFANEAREVADSLMKK